MLSRKSFLKSQRTHRLNHPRSTRGVLAVQDGALNGTKETSLRMKRRRIMAALAVACTCTSAHAFTQSIASARTPRGVCCRHIGLRRVTAVAFDPTPASGMLRELAVEALRSGSDTIQRIQLPPRGRSSAWLKNLISIPFSRTFNRIWGHFISIVLTAVVTCLITQIFPQSLMIVKGLSTTAHSLVGGALGLLLVFRTNSAYDRFWESRKLWSTMISNLRQFSRMAHAAMTGWDREHLLRLLAAFPPILLHHLRCGRGGGTVTQREALLEILPAADVDIIWRSRHRPLTVYRMLAYIVKAAFADPRSVLRRFPNAGDRGKNLTSIEVNMIMTNVKADLSLSQVCLQSVSDTISSCERIVKTSVPLAYSKHTSRFLSVFLFSLPLVLVESLGWRTVPVVAVIGWALLSIEEVGNSIEDPFNMPHYIAQAHSQLNPFSQDYDDYVDELKLERSFKNIRADVMDRSPYYVDETAVAHAQDETAVSWAIPVFDDDDYDVTLFHRASRKDTAESLEDISADALYAVSNTLLRNEGNVTL
jgi:putative membrane protein